MKVHSTAIFCEATMMFEIQKYGCGKGGKVNIPWFPLQVSVIAADYAPVTVVYKKYTHYLKSCHDSLYLLLFTCLCLLRKWTLGTSVC